VWTQNLDRILAVGPHFKQDTDARILAHISRWWPGWDDLDERAQNAWKPARLDGDGIASSIPTCIHPHQASGGAKIRSLNALSRDGSHHCESPTCAVVAMSGIAAATTEAGLMA
jgi:hypothetical protein